MLTFFAIILVVHIYTPIALALLEPKTPEAKERLRKRKPTYKEAFIASMMIGVIPITWALCECFPDIMFNVTVGGYIILGLIACVIN